MTHPLFINPSSRTLRPFFPLFPLFPTQVLAADIAKERSVIVTVAADSTARLWNYETLKCEVVHSFRSDEPVSVAMHASGQSQIILDEQNFYMILSRLRSLSEI